MMSAPYWAIVRATEPSSAPRDLAAYARLEYQEANAAWILADLRTTRGRPAAIGPASLRRRAPLKRLVSAVASIFL